MIIINLDYLRSFFVIVESNSISKASKKLHLTQPGLSMQLQNLENEIGAKLLIRSNKGVILTEEGSIVYEHAKTLLSLESNIKKTIKDLKENKNILSINACKSLGEYVLPCSIYTFKEIYTDLDVFLEVYDTSVVIKKLNNHEVNMAIITGDDSNENLITKPILKDELVLVTSNDSDIDEIDINELVNLPIILREASSSTRLILSNILKEHSIDIDDLNIAMSINSPESIKSAILSGRGFAFLPKIVVRPELRSGRLKAIKIKDLDTSFNYNLAYRADTKLTPYEERFKKFISSNKRCFCY